MQSEPGCLSDQMNNTNNRARLLQQILERCSRAYIAAEGRPVDRDIEGMLYLTARAMGADVAALVVAGNQNQPSMVTVAGSCDLETTRQRLQGLSLQALDSCCSYLSDIEVFSVADTSTLASIWRGFSHDRPALFVPIVAANSVRALLMLVFAGPLRPLNSAVRSALVTLTHMSLAYIDVARLSGQLQFQLLLMDEAADFAAWGCWEYVVGERQMRVSPTLQKMLGISIDEMARLPAVLQRVHEEDHPRVAEVVTAAVSQNKGYNIQFRMRLGDGQYALLRAVTCVSGQQPGLPVRRYGFVRKVEASTQPSLADVHAGVIEHMDQGVVVFHRDGRIKSVNSAFSEISGVPKEMLIGARWQEIAHLWSLPKPLTGIVRQAMKDRFWQQEVTFRPVGGPSGQHRLRLVPLDGEESRNEHLSLIISGHNREEAEGLRMDWLVNRDLMTGLPNRHQIAYLLDDAIAEQQADEKLVVMVLNLDSFRQINDSYGHAFGNKLLCSWAERLAAMGLGQNQVSRLGSDEFALFATGIQAQTEIDIMISMVRQLAATPFRVSEHQNVFSSASMGISVYPDHGKTASQLLGNADTALHEAKRRGPGSICFYNDELTRVITERLELTNELRLALQGTQGLQLHYQPQINARSGRVVGLEALVRWQHPRHGLLMPGRFMPCAESAGLMPELDRFVLRAAAAMIAHWRQQGIALVPVAVNVTQQSFAAGNLHEQLQWLQRKHDLQAGDLEIELTEGTLLEPTRRVLEMVNAIRELGFGMVIDDFGTGYSSLSYLHRFPLQKLKIDRSFVSGLESTPESRVITRTIVKMAQELGLGLVAEGVESDRQAEYLCSIGCDVHQGFYYEHALTPEQTALLLQG
nr:GGDEF and EAL domain-containing protein [Oceanobacter mangrovi]